MVRSLSCHSYCMIDVHAGNATTNDLWAALSEASGKDVNVFMVCLRIMTPLARADLRLPRIHGSERSDFRSLLLRKSPDKLAFANPVSSKQET